MELRPLPLTLLPSLKDRCRQLVMGLLVLGLGYADLAMELGKPAGWTLVIIGGLLTLFSAILMIPGAASLTLDEQGFHVVSLFRRTSYRWDEVESFGVYSPTRNRQMVGFNFLPGRRATSLLMRTSREKIGYEAGLADIYGHTPTDLAALLNAYRERHAASSR